ncbi:hypothetical protein E2C01_026296 [Portunus trituberculatus]|uniref:Uncharacterized protein n=1 Tax=Portunus trituberculatus TaxID=210409 RepID=A0A5B7EHQ4_PORTR|nr:hypothetical protein [Portunus trituberculatus]
MWRGAGQHVVVVGREGGEGEVTAGGRGQPAFNGRLWLVGVSGIPSLPTAGTVEGRALLGPPRPTSNAQDSRDPRPRFAKPEWTTVTVALSAPQDRKRAVHAAARCPHPCNTGEGQSQVPGAPWPLLPGHCRTVLCCVGGVMPRAALSLKCGAVTCTTY